EVKLLRLLIQQEDAKDLIVYDFAHQFGHPAQGSVEIERGVHHVGYFEQEWLNPKLRLGWWGCHFHISMIAAEIFLLGSHVNRSYAPRAPSSVVGGVGMT